MATVDDVRATYQGYLAAIHAQCTEAVLAYVAEPFVRICDGVTQVFKDKGEIRAWFDHVFANFAQQRYAETVPDTIDVTVFALATASVSMVGTRVDDEGKAIARIGSVYLFNRTERRGWRIAVVIPFTPSD